MVRLYDPDDRTADIFALNAGGTVLVSPVDCTGAQGAGLALAFKAKWPHAAVWYKARAKSGLVSPGTLLWTHIQDTSQKPSFQIMAPHATVLFFPTKLHWSQPSTLDIVQRGLAALPDTLAVLTTSGPHPVGKYPRRIAIPALGCGEGELDYDDVRPLILAAAPLLERVGYEVHVFPQQPWRDSPRARRRGHS